MRNTLLLIIILSLISCSKEKRTDNFNVVEIDLTTPTDSVCYLSQIADSMIYYPLCVDSTQLATFRGVSVSLGTNYIWAYFWPLGSLYKRATGELIKAIPFGPLLKSPYNLNPSMINTYFLSEEDNMVIHKRIEKRNKSYYSSVVFRLTTGERIDSIPFPKYNFFQINDSLVVQVPESRDTCPPYSLKWYDTDVRFLKEDTFTDSILGYYYPGHITFNLLRDKIYYHPPISKTIYEVSPNHQPIPVYRYNIGNKEPEYYKIYQQKSLRVMYQEDMDVFPYYFIIASYISDNYIFGGFFYKTHRYQMLFNRNTHQKWIIPTHQTYWEYTSKIGIINDLDGGIDFWPKKISKQGEMYNWYFTDSLKTKVNRTDISKMKNPAAALKLKKMLDDLPKEANIIVTVLKEKNNKGKII